MIKEMLPVNRGRVDDADAVFYKEKTGRDITKTELRLLPLLHHMYMTTDPVNGNRINQEEHDVLKQMTDSGFIAFGRARRLVGFYDVKMSKESWDVIVKMLYDTYAAKVKEQPELKGSYQELVGREIDRDEMTAIFKLCSAVMNGGYIDEKDLTQKVMAAFNRFNKKGLIYFAPRGPEAERYNVAIAEVFWYAINDVLFSNVAIVEEVE